MMLPQPDHSVNRTPIPSQQAAVSTGARLWQACRNEPHLTPGRPESATCRFSLPGRPGGAGVLGRTGVSEVASFTTLSSQARDFSTDVLTLLPQSVVVRVASCVKVQSFGFIQDFRTVRGSERGCLGAGAGSGRRRAVRHTPNVGSISATSHSARPSCARPPDIATFPGGKKAGPMWRHLAYGGAAGRAFPIRSEPETLVDRGWVGAAMIEPPAERTDATHSDERRRAPPCRRAGFGDHRLPCVTFETSATRFP